MDIFKKLAELADDLDQRGLIAEATEVDSVLQELIKSAESWPTQGPVSRYEPEEGTTIEVQRKNPAMQKHVQNLQELRKMVGLDPNPNGPLFDRQLAKLLNTYYPGAWQPRTKQRSSDLLAAVKEQAASNVGFAGTRKDPAAPAGAEPRGGPTGQMQSIEMPSTTPNPEVDLGEKPDAKLP